MSYSTFSPRHPLMECADALEKALAQTTGVDPAYLPTEDKADVLRRFTTLSSQLEALRLRVMATAEDVAAVRADKRVADWVARETRCDKPAAHAQQRLAEALEHRWTRLGAAVAAGEVLLDQARVIVRALDALPTEVGPEVRLLAEEQLVRYAAEFGPRDLSRLAERILTYVAPEIAEDHERIALERAEARAEADTRLNVKTRHDGALVFSGVLPPVEGAILRTALDALASPRRRDTAGGWTDIATGMRLSAEQARGEALRTLIAGLDPAKLGRHAGQPVSVFVTTTLESLTTGLGAAGLSTGERITPGAARRLACGAGLIPAVLGSRSEVLDLGRKVRLHTPGQRRAKLLSTSTCQVEGCTVPAAWCESHHRRPWSQGGRTDHANHDLLCGWHHRRVHDSGYTADRHPNGIITLHRRT